MPDIYLGRFGILTVAGEYKPGDPPPSSYGDWHEWAEVQHKAGLRQATCPRCGKWKFPQELSGVIDEQTARTGRGANRGGGVPFVVRKAVCLKCVRPADARPPREDD